MNSKANASQEFINESNIFSERNTDRRTLVCIERLIVLIKEIISYEAILEVLFD